MAVLVGGGSMWLLSGQAHATVNSALGGGVSDIVRRHMESLPENGLYIPLQAIQVRAQPNRGGGTAQFVMEVALDGKTYELVVQSNLLDGATPYADKAERSRTGFEAELTGVIIRAKDDSGGEQ